MSNQNILLASFFVIIFCIIGFKIFRFHNSIFSIELLSKIKKDLQNSYDLATVLETRDRPPYLKFSISEDLNEAFLIIQETLKGFEYETHRHVFFMNDSLQKASFVVCPYDKSNHQFDCEIICTNFKRGIGGKSEYRIYVL